MPGTIRRTRTATWAPALVLTLATGLGLGACGDNGGDRTGGGSAPAGPGTGSQDTVHFVLGAGTGASGGAAVDTKVPGVLQAMTVDRHGRVAVLVGDAQGFALWTTSGAGADATSAVRRITGLPAAAAYSPTGGIGHIGAQAAAAPDGSYYVALGPQGLWRIAADGRAERLVDANGAAKAGRDGPAASFATGEVRGVAVADDGTVYFSDYQTDPAIGFVRKLAGGAVTTIAGKSFRSRAEAAGTGIGPTELDLSAGGPATGVLLAYGPNTGALAWHAGTVYARTGDAIIKVTASGQAIPLVVGRRPSSLTQPDQPFRAFGQGYDAVLSTPFHGDEGHTAGIAYDPDTKALFFASGAPLPSLAGSDLHAGLGHSFDWTGDFTAAQYEHIEASRTNQFVAYDSADGRLAGALTDSDTIAVYDGSLYAANDTCGDTATICDPAKTTVAVVRRAVPAG